MSFHIIILGICFFHRCLVHRGLSDNFLMLSQIVSGFVGHLMDLQVSNHVVLGESSSLLCHSSSICVLRS